MDEMSVLKTLRRVPDRIILATMGRDLDLHSRQSCLCGWFIREKLAEAQNVGASLCANPISDEYIGTPGRCAGMFGGSPGAWEDIFIGVTHQAGPRGEDESEMAIVERAFVRRVDEAVNPRRQRSRRKAGV